MSRRHLMLKIVLPLLILSLGIGGMLLLVKSRQVPPQQSPENRGILVETMVVKPTDHRVEVLATGTVQPRQQADIVPQVSGKIVEIAPQLVAGGFFRRGELLLAVEAVDYRLAVERAEANLSRFELDLETVRARAAIARQEWDQLHPGEAAPPLVVLAPQLKNAEAALQSARAALELARLDLERTRLTAPFNCYVRSETTAAGQFVRAGTSLAVVVGTDQAEIITPVPLDDLIWLDVPRRNGDQGSPARISLQIGDRAQLWAGYVDRSLAEVDARGRMARLAVVVDDPFGLKQQQSGVAELAIGSFVNLTLQGKVLEQVVALPRQALRDHDTAWTVDDRNRLRIKSVDIVRREREQVLVGTGIDTGDQVVLTGIAAAVDGMLLRPQQREAQP
ncbi:MAG: efflux RND transporter periplasmic adaptor subunit [Desulfuromonas sp.]|nr:MAG: efflux RND transporter periplasmic adaptor subunit [Desulfuromonas sp.]